MQFLNKTVDFTIVIHSKSSLIIALWPDLWNTWQDKVLMNWDSDVSAWQIQTHVSHHSEGELAMQLECCQTEVEFVRRRLKQTEEKLEMERQTRQQLDTKVREDTL